MSSSVPTTNDFTAGQPKPLRILCFGDSLTEGYNRYGTSFDPYCIGMLERLGEILNPGYEIEVEERGVSGECVTAGFETRIGEIYSTNPPPRWDWLLFLGGTNDIAWGKPNTEIHSTIQRITSLALSHGAKILLMTVPECGVNITSLNHRRDELNSLIKSDTRENVYIFDLKEKIPYHAMDEKERKVVWGADGLHMTKEGYEKMGNMFAERLGEILKGEVAR